MKNRILGENLYISEIYKIVESVKGVENSICVLNDDPEIKVINADDESTIVCLDTDNGSTLKVTVEDYKP